MKSLRRLEPVALVQEIRIITIILEANIDPSSRSTLTLRHMLASSHYCECQAQERRKRRHKRKKQTAEVQPELPSSKEPASSHPPVDAHLYVNNVPALPCLTTEVSQLALAVANPGQAIPQDAQLSDVVVEPEIRLEKKLNLNDSILDNTQSLSDVNYRELDNSIPGVCVESGDKLVWSPIKITRNCVKAASNIESSGNSSDDELKPSECASNSFKRRFDIPGFEIETHDNEYVFWIPIALRTQSCLKTS